MIKDNLAFIQFHSLSGLRQKTKQSGFTLIEVLVTILVVTGFVLGSLQAVVLATFFRVQAQDKNEALNWVQQDLELIRYQAFMLEEDSDSCGDYGEVLRDQIISIGYDPEDDFIIGQGDNLRSYSLRREYSPSDNTLQITHVIAYGLADDSSSENIHPRYNSNKPYDYDDMIPVNKFREENLNYVTTLSTEVIPDAALSCE